MRIGKERMFVLFALASLIVSLMFFNTKASETSSTTISVDPPTITVPFSENFTVNINIENVTDLFAWQTWLKWYSPLLGVVNVSEGDFLKSANVTSWYSLVNQSEGWIFAFSSYYSYPYPAMNGNGTLANVTFHCTGLGECVLSLNDTKLFDSSPVSVTTPPYLGDANGDMIVDADDLNIIIWALASSVGDPNWAPNADFNNDGFVDLFDLLCGLFNWGIIYPGNALQPVEITHEAHDGYVINGAPVGGIYIPVNKLALLAPYIGLTIMLAVAVIAVVYVKKRKRHTEIIS